MEIGFFRKTKTAKLPTKAYENALGFDLYASEARTLLPNQLQLIPTGIICVFPTLDDVPYGGIIKDRSGTAKRKIFTHAGVIDNDYRGEIFVMMHNANSHEEVIEEGEKFAQMVLIPQYDFSPIEIFDLPDMTERGDKAFGSSGR